MKKKVYVFLADGFEEIEAITPLDVLRRAEIETVSVSISSTKRVTGAHGITVEADVLLTELNIADADLIVLPGGMPGTKNLAECQLLLDTVLAHAQAGKLTAAICAAPSILGMLDLLKGKEATCFPGWEDKLTGALYDKVPCIVDGNIVTSRGPGTAMEFSMRLVELLTDATTASELARRMIVTRL